MLVNDLLEQLENSPLPPRLLHLIIPAEAILDHAESVQKLRLAGCRIVLSPGGPRSANLQLAESEYGRLPAT